MAYIQFKLEDGTIVYIESADSPRGSSGLLPGGKGEHGDHPAVSFSDSVQTVGKMASSLLNNLRQAQGDEPEEIQVNFGLKASGEVASLVVARGGMEANFNVMLRWRSQKEEKPEEEKKPEKDNKGSAAE